MKNKRRYERHPESLQMFVEPDSGEARTYTTRDVSDGGLFLFALTTEQLPVGTTIIVSPARHVPGITPPAIKARVVRSSAQGMGIEFIDEGSI